MSGFSKSIDLGSAGKLDLSELAGVVTAKLSLSESVGGGSVAGVVKGTVSAEVDFGAQQLIDAGLALVKAKYPALAAVVDAVQSGIDAEIAKV